MFRVVLFCVVLCAIPKDVFGHSYALGGCPSIEPMIGFDMSKMLGVWYVIQKTSTGSGCLIYNFTRGEEPGEYLIEQKSQHVVLGLTPLDHTYRYTGKLSVSDPDIPARMTVNFPLSVAGTAKYTVFATDYENYAGIFTCQKVTFSHRQSVSILSRHKSLDKMYVDKIRTKLSAANINPFDLSIISQKDCSKTDEGVDIDINPDTFSPKNVGNAFKKVGDKIGDGVSYVASGIRKVYNKLVTKDGEEHHSGEMSGRVMAHPDSEWLP